ncbi:aromatic amino acid exporter YddG [Fuscibacter oryzae]|uniref:EamA family transporter n=1 Tax=Fuscibacter oryzae TaxID=2803939 RepID=A0A8J7MLJ6_9RHOB|nr:EamA family transporter [Fuscibacter oryzae]MBL4927015.1 EamA family transporter [Fuscibacter oryzae]
MTRQRATTIGFTAILMWALLALLTIGSAPVPPFLLNALCFGIGGGLGLIWLALGPGFDVLRGISWKVYAFGSIALFGYHALYFTAFRIAPAAETGLIAYLWPLFIVLLSGLLPGERLGPLHILGALIAFAGAALILLGRGDTGASVPVAGLVLAFLCAITWAAYSVLSRRLGQVPTESVIVYCLATAALSLLVHLAFEETIWPASRWGWLSVIALGLGPVGAAFFTWDVGMKKGDIQLLGVASYAAPLLSTLALVAGGRAQATPILLLAAALITGGAALAARASLRPVRPAEDG